MSWPDISEFPLYFLRMAKIALFGDSYIKRLGKYLGVPGECRFFGVGGKRADRPHQEVLNQLLEFQPDAMFVFIGGNDISVNSSPRQTFDDIVNIMDSIDYNGATTVYIGEILTRGQFSNSPGLTKDIFDRKRELINKKHFRTFISQTIMTRTTSILILPGLQQTQHTLLCPERRNFSVESPVFCVDIELNCADIIVLILC